MKIKSVRIVNFRAFKDVTVSLGGYTCFVGPNGAGKSTVLAALNVFFKERGWAGAEREDLCDEDFFERDTSHPLRIVVTYNELSDAATTELFDYVRAGELVVEAEATYDTETGSVRLRHVGRRKAMPALGVYFEAEKSRKPAAELKSIYAGLRATHPELPPPGTKEQMAAALRAYEAERPESCELLPSEDEFYGINGAGKLAPFLQWVYVPAVKDARDEGLEAKNTALGKLMARAVRNRTSFDEQLQTLRAEVTKKYETLLADNRAQLETLSNALSTRLSEWAHPGARLQMDWVSDSGKSIQVHAPVAGIKTGDGAFLGSLARMGHGLQRSYLLALLQELASSGPDQGPTLVLGCEEPELYQHPPQARHLADVFCRLGSEGSQVLVTTHSPYFVRGQTFDDVRVVRHSGAGVGASVSACALTALASRLGEGGGAPSQQLPKQRGLIAKIHQALQPQLAEMFFAKVPILVEGLEDVAYITTYLHLSGKWDDFRRWGCQLVPANGKSCLITPLAVARELGLPVFVVYDSDGVAGAPNQDGRHKKDNLALTELLGAELEVFPTEAAFGHDYAVWPSNLTEAVKADLGEHYPGLKQQAEREFGQPGGLDKNHLFVAALLTAAYEQGIRPPTLEKLCTAILDFAGSAQPASAPRAAPPLEPPPV